MKHQLDSKRLFKPLIILLLLSSSGLFAAPRWEKIINRNGIQVYRRDHKTSSIVEFKGQGIVKASVPKLLALLQDISLMPKWVEGCKKAKMLYRNFNSRSYNMSINSYKVIVYGLNKIPWPLSDRDYVLLGRISYNKKSDAVIMNLHETKHKSMPPKSGIVRMPAMRTRLTLIPKNNDAHTWVQLYVHVDPGGIIPSWIVNFVSKSIPLKSIKKLRVLARRTNYDKAMEKLVLHHVQKLRRSGGFGIPANTNATEVKKKKKKKKKRKKKKKKKR